MVSSDLYGYGVAHKQSIKAQHRVDTILGFSEDSGMKPILL